jgi:hypothetical protein
MAKSIRKHANATIVLITGVAIVVKHVCCGILIVGPMAKWIKPLASVITALTHGPDLTAISAHVLMSCVHIMVSLILYRALALTAALGGLEKSVTFACVKMKIALMASLTKTHANA